VRLRNLVRPAVGRQAVAAAFWPGGRLVNLVGGRGDPLSLSEPMPSVRIPLRIRAMGWAPFGLAGGGHWPSRLAVYVLPDMPRSRSVKVWPCIELAVEGRATRT